MIGTRQFISLGLVIGMMSVGNPSVVGQGTIKKSPPNILSAEIKALSIGDKVPDITFHNVLNYKSKKAKLSDFKGKLVILDMWSISCASCIKGFPKMEALQKRFSDRIQILLVNPHDAKFDSEEKIKSTLDKLKTRTGFYPSLPIPIHDSVLNSYFPHKSVPHQVWIDGKGNVVAITTSNEVTEERMESLLAGKEINLPVKNDWAFDRKIPLLIESNNNSKNFPIYRSMFTGAVSGQGFSSGSRMNEKNEVIGFYILNASLRDLVGTAYLFEINHFSKKRIILEVADPSKYFWDCDVSDIYSYDLIIPPIPSRIFNPNNYLKEDLKRVFNVRVYKETRLMKCIIVSTTKILESSFTKYKAKEFDLEKNSIKKYIHNYPIPKVIQFLDNFNLPLIDETGRTHAIDLDFPDHFNLENKDALLGFLEKVGFSVKEGERLIEVAVITDR